MTTQLEMTMDERKYKQLVSIVVQAVDTEMSKLLGNEKALSTVFDFLNDHHRYTNHYKFFSGGFLTSLSQDIFSNVSIRDYVLNLTQAVDVELFLSGLFIDRESYNRELLGPLVEGLTLNTKPPVNLSRGIAPAVITEELAKTPKELLALLVDNNWLVILYLAVITFNLTVSYNPKPSK